MAVLVSHMEWGWVGPTSCKGGQGLLCGTMTAQSPEHRSGVVAPSSPVFGNSHSCQCEPAIPHVRSLNHAGLVMVLVTG